MHCFLHPSRNCVLLILAAGLVLGGCRSYGSHGSVETTKQQMQLANDNFEDELLLARANLQRLERRADSLEGITPFINQYALLVEQHDLLLEHHRHEVEDALDSDNYRPLARLYGAIIAEQQVISKRYQNLLTGPRMPVDAPRALAADTVAPEVAPEGRYVYFPPFYQRMQSRISDRAPLLEDPMYLQSRSAALDSLGISAGPMEDEADQADPAH